MNFLKLILGLLITASTTAVTCGQAPSVTTSAATDITSTTATFHGEVTSQGGSTIIERGFVYSLEADDPTPTVAEANGSTVIKIAVAGTTGAFSEGITGLTLSTSYSVVAYATNATGTTEGPASIFATNTPPVFFSNPRLEVNVNDAYTYFVNAPIFGTEITITAPTLPSWLSYASGLFTETFAGTGSIGNTNGSIVAPSDVSFNSPNGMVLDEAYIYITDQGNHTIRQIDMGNVTTFAGSGTAGSTDANGVAASFNNPAGIALDYNNGDLYVADQGNHTIRKIAPSGDVTTLAGSGTAGSTDGNGIAASFNSPTDLVWDIFGNIYVVDRDNHKIRKIAPNGDVTTLAGSGTYGSTDGNGIAASFNNPVGIALDYNNGNLYVADQGNHTIRKITPTGEVTTVAGSGVAGSTDGNGITASFSSPNSLSLDENSILYVADQGNHAIRMIDVNGDVTTLAGTGTAGMVDGLGTSASFDNPTGIFALPFGGAFVVDQGNHSIRRVLNRQAIYGTAPALAGTHDVVIDADDGTESTQQSFTITVNTPPAFTSEPVTGIEPNAAYTYTITTEDPGDNVSLTAPTLPAWLSLGTVSTGDVTTLAGSAAAGSTDGNGTAASFNNPFGVAVDGASNVYVADFSNNKIRKIAPNGDVTTLAGSAAGGSADDNGTAATFSQPAGVSVDGTGNVYVADRSNNKIRKIAPNGDVTTLAGSGTAGSTDGNGTAASFNLPASVAVDGADNVYVADFSNNKIRKIAPNGDVTTLAGSGTAGSTDGNGTAASFNLPASVAVDGAGNVYVADRGNHKIRKIASNGDVTTLAGSGIAGSTDANGSAASFNEPYGVAVDGAGKVYVADRGNHKIRKIAPNGDVITLAGSGSGSTDANGTAARFNTPLGVAVDGTGNVYVADRFNHKIRKIASMVQLTGTAPAPVGNHNVVLEATDTHEGITQQSFTILVNTKPVVTTSAADAITANSATLHGTATSDAAVAITERGFVYALTANDATPTLVEVDGANVIKVVAAGTTDAFSEIITGLTASTNYSYVAYATNAIGSAEGSTRAFRTTPVLAGIGAQTGDELTEITFTASATAGSFGLDATSTAKGMSIDATSGVFSWTPTEAQDGTHDVTVTVSDGTLTTSEVVVITVNEVNTAPVLATIGIQSGDEGTAISFTATATDADLPANTLSFSIDATSVDKGMTINTTTGVFSWTPIEEQDGLHEVTVTVSDGTLTASEVVTITVNDVDNAPVLSAIGAQSSDELTEITFTAIATDEGVSVNTLIFSIDATATDKGMSIDAATGVFSWTPTEAQSGSHEVTVTVSDGSLSDEEVVTITINEVNTAPVLTDIGAKSGDEGTSIGFTATATDADLPANMLSFSLNAAATDKGMSIGANSGVFSWTPSEGQGGTHELTVTVSDGTLTDSEVVTITVNEIVLSAISDYSIIRLYPNPVVNQLTVEVISKMEISVIDLGGKVVLRQVVTPSNNTIELKSLKSGVYTLLLRADNKEEHYKVIKK